MTKKRFVLTLSCDDRCGIVGRVSGFLANEQFFIVESAQWGDDRTEKFFMRCVFETEDTAIGTRVLKDKFESVALDLNMDFEIYDVTSKSRLLLMVSKQGHCLHEILHRWASGELLIDIPAVVSNHPDLELMVKGYNIPFHYMPIDEANKSEQEAKLLEMIESLEIDTVVLARYMQVLSPSFVKQTYGRVINIHHSFLPSFKGAKPYHQAFDRGVKIIGATAHYVTDELDEGPIIDQEVTRVNHAHTPDKLCQMGRSIESSVLAKAVQHHIEHRVLLNGNKTVVFD